MEGASPTILLTPISRECPALRFGWQPLFRVFHQTGYSVERKPLRTGRLGMPFPLQWRRLWVPRYGRRLYMATNEALLTRERQWLHSELIRTGTLAISTEGIATNADKGNKASREIAANVARQLMSETRERQAGQTSGAAFESLVAEFLRRTFCG